MSGFRASKPTSRPIPETEPSSLGASVYIATFGISVLALALPLVLLQVFDRVIPNQSLATLDVLFVGLIVALCIDLLFKLCRIAILGFEGERHEIGLTRRVVARIVGAQPEAFEHDRAGTHIDRQDAIATLRDFHGGQARLLHIDLPFTLVFGGMIFLIGGWLVLVPAACMSVLLVFRAILKRMQGPILSTRRVLNERRYSFLIEFLSAIVTVKSFGMEAQMARRYELLQDQSVDASRRLTSVTQFSQSFGAVFSQGAVAAMGLFGSYLVMTDRIGVAELAACMLLNGRTIQPMLKLLGVWVQGEVVDESRRQLGEVFALPQRPAALTGESLKGGITLRGVQMSRGGKKLVDDLDLEIAPGDCLGVTGADGSGKSTLMQVLLGEYSPQAGTALLDGRAASDWSEARGHKGIVYVGNDPVIFEGTVLQNLSLFGDADAIARALAVSRRIGLEQDIHALPLGYGTPIRSGGGLTKGWLQRICIARALALEPKILLLNEPNTALDHKGDAAVLAALRALKGETTLAIASRRPSWLDLADRVVDLSVGGDTIAAWDADLASDSGIGTPLSAERLIA